MSEAWGAWAAAWHAGTVGAPKATAAAPWPRWRRRAPIRGSAGLCGRDTIAISIRACRPAHHPHQLRRHRVLGRRAHAAADGTALVDFPLPDSLTTWKVKTWTLGPGTKVGQAESEIVTSKDLLVRLQAPRFFVEKDEVVLSANVHNKLKSKKSVQVVLELEGSVSQPMGETRADRADRRRLGAPGRLARQGRPRRAGRDPHEGAHRRRVRRRTDEFPGIRSRHAQDGSVRRRDPARRAEGAGGRSRSLRAQAGPVAARSARIRPRWPARWSTPCPTWPTTPTAAPSRP